MTTSDVVVRSQPGPGVDDLRSAFDNAPIGIAVLTLTGTVRNANRALGRLLGRSPADLVGTTLFEVTHADDLALATTSCARLQTAEVDLVDLECRFCHGDGSVLWVQVTTSRVAEDGERPAHLIMHVQSVEQRKALEARLTHQAMHDPLTGLANRALLRDRTSHALDRARRSGGTLSVLFVDLDGFKRVNDVHGHEAGDRVLVEYARRLEELLRPGDTAARVGGDEFVVLCEDTDSAAARIVAARLRAAGAAPFLLDGGSTPVQLGATVGISSGSCVDGLDADPDALLRQADADMYQARGRRR